MLKTGSRLSIFPLPGALLFPRSHLPLHIFEPRYRAMVSDALARDRRIAMIQPRPGEESDRPALFDIGCLGRIAHVEALEDGRFNLVLEGLSRFRTVRELDAGTPFRQIEASFDDFAEDADEDQPVLASILRADLENHAKAFARRHGYQVDWESVGRLDDEALVNGIAQIAPFDIAAKQALLEARDVPDRADLLVQFLRFFGPHDGDEATLQ
ncbi:LON peptidase substrate-binding domain-containing protein [Sphingomonas nostoxanthinifaciens]|uniref:LON peptidase substrate-binding domain-containing protein n=1 Tax=Sphingomonas nostoxanthinifaciens TaxID=2872652 RepID=UPI001CC204D4|nr:LON peptidase substrate-binding domain-containing protein [Sphingomonas nostoxanthinifaciens]UAK26229.1 LON peptidase substrate-binding domain-containing protein [Sphingomonas nostoxanthinifaciens]